MTSSRYSIGALAAIVHENASTAGELHSLNLHVTVAEDAIRRWPNDPELSCLSCWVLRSVVEPEPPKSKKIEPPKFLSLRRGAAESGGSACGEDGDSSCSGIGVVDSSGMEGEDTFTGAVGSRSGGNTGGDGGNNGSGSVGQVQGSTGSGSVFGMGENETSDYLISLADDEDYDGHNEATTTAISAAGKVDEASPAVSSVGGSGIDPPSPTTTQAIASTSTKIADTATATTNSIRAGEVFTQKEGQTSQQQQQQQQEQQQQQQQRPGADDALAGQSQNSCTGGDLKAGVELDAKGEGAEEAPTKAEGVFEGERDQEALEGFLKLAEATKVSYDNSTFRSTLNIEPTAIPAGSLDES